MKTVEIAVIVKHETDRAYLVDAGLKEEVWIPKRCVVDQYLNRKGEGTLEIKESFAYEKGLI